MRRLSAIQLSAVFLLFSAIAPAMVAQTHSPQPEKTGQAARQRQGFFDYALGKINPANTDYGAAMADGRSDLVGHTIDDLYFWSNAVTLCLLVCAAGIVYFEWRSAAKKEIVAATIIAELWNGRVSDKSKLCAVPSNSTNSLNCKIRKPSGCYPPGRRRQNRNRRSPEALQRASVESDIRVHRLQVPRQRVRSRLRAQPNRQQWRTRMMVRRACNRATFCCNAGLRRSKTARKTSSKD